MAANINIVKVVKKAAERKRFAEATKKAREEEAARHTQLNLPPVFNKRHFCKGDVIVTSEARRIMVKNSLSFMTDDQPLTRNEISAMRCVVDGLRLIHKGVDYVKDCLAQCVTFEKHNPFQYVTKQQHESSLSCYYILHGSVEVTYDFSVSNSLQVFEPNIIYTHTSGEYLGLVRAEEDVQDISPPATVYTKEPCECLRVDRLKFHRTISRTRVNDIQEKENYMADKRCVLADLTAEERTKLVPKLLKVEFPPNKVIIRQGATDGEFVYFIISGRCKFFRNVILLESDKEVIFELDKIEEGALFGEECVLDPGQPCPCSVVTSCLTTCYKINRCEFKLKDTEHLIQLLTNHRHVLPSDEMLRNYGYSETLWKSYRESQVQDVVAGDAKPHFDNGREILRLQKNRQVSLSFDDTPKKRGIYSFLINEPKGQSSRSSRTQSARLPLVNPSVFQPAPANRNRSKSAASNNTENKVSALKPISPSDVDQKLQLEFIPKLMKNKGGHSKDFLLKVVEEYSKLHTRSICSQGSREKGPDIDARDLIRRFRLYQNPEEVRRAKWLFAAETIDYNILLTNSYPIEVDTKAMIKRAAAISEQYTEKLKAKRQQPEPQESWCTPIHEERETAKTQMAFDRFRTEILRRRLHKQKETKDSTSFLKHFINAERSYEDKINTTEDDGVKADDADSKTPKMTRRDTRSLFLRRSNPRNRTSSGLDLRLNSTIGTTTPSSSSIPFPRLKRVRTASVISLGPQLPHTTSPRKAKTPGAKNQTSHFDFSDTTTGRRPRSLSTTI
ncbi:uncharacterized protein LOC135497192 [Lineus longissimus]|uniref:uncharacterized protein LOC135497192 n=1 Tax=Lineus longissimus TaxID=88925 RepID=UPI00315C5C80